MTISGHTRVFQILGDPVAQVRAPEVINHLFQAHKIDAVLVPAEVESAHLTDYVRSTFAARNAGGFWLTIPHKSAVMPILDHCDPLGRLAGAVNAVRRNADGSIEGALFDGLGFVKALQRTGFQTAGRRALLVGIGGAGLAIAASLVTSGLRQIALHDNQIERARAAAQRLGPVFDGELNVMPHSHASGFDLVINATPLGLRADDGLPFDVNTVDAHATVVDILMKDQRTPLLKACDSRGIAAHSGHEMLVQQISDYFAFFGYADIAQAVRADATEVRQLLQPTHSPS